MIFGILMIVLLIVAIIVFAIVFKRFHGKTFRLAFVCGHLFFIFVVGFIILVQNDDAQTGLLWLIPVFTDMPVSLIFFPMRQILPGLGPHSILGPFIFFAIFGSAEYFFYGIIIDFIKNLYGQIIYRTKTNAKKRTE